jgi:hypothetical protein
MSKPSRPGDLGNADVACAFHNASADDRERGLGLRPLAQWPPGTQTANGENVLLRLAYRQCSLAFGHTGLPQREEPDVLGRLIRRHNRIEQPIADRTNADGSGTGVIQLTLSMAKSKCCGPIVWIVSRVILLSAMMTKQDGSLNASVKEWGRIWVVESEVESPTLRELTELPRDVETYHDVLPRDFIRATSSVSRRCRANRLDRRS